MEASNDEELLFTKKMRRATRDVHSISDALVNAKLGLVLSDSRVWAEGLLVFYDIFAFLEAAMQRCAVPWLSQLDIVDMRRQAAFESDLRHFYGADWMRSHTPRPQVVAYLRHLQDLEQRRPHLLAAYVYHLYMGLLSGGQLLRRKRELAASLFAGSGKLSEGNAVTTFTCRPAELKRQLASAMNHCAAELLDQQQRQELIEESREVFARNNAIVASIRGTNQALLLKLAKILAAIVLAILLFWVFWRFV